MAHVLHTTFYAPLRLFTESTWISNKLQHLFQINVGKFFNDAFVALLKQPETLEKSSKSLCIEKIKKVTKKDLVLKCH